ncbi:class C sortase [Pseudactinotalea sp. HY160]|uniref:class C sortase n=1 Tax=Pseudactinotalea sp. HY160 TaxID=2654490 RepID=UPI00128ADEB9|nr:class C sortase [Pseudactinotalea sp. HY160]MPV51348.1 class C sortase [Pseudactinotalea sp. HY160]
MPWATAGVALLAVIGVLAILYPSTASWFSQYNQSKVVEGLDSVVDEGPPARLMNELDEARAYNDALVGGELGTGALLDPSSNVPTSDGVSPGGFDYNELLRATNDGVMARLRIPAIKVDLPIYHGTSDDVLAKGVGHLEGTSLPVGGLSQHSVLTAHRGLPEATLFNDLNKLAIGDTFTIEVFGEVLTYQVNSTQTILPDETQSLLPEYGEDLVTLVTCTPLGINTHRYLVTGERILPTPAADIAAAGTRPDIPGFPWWAVSLGGVVVTYAAIIVIAGRPKKTDKPMDDARSPRA